MTLKASKEVIGVVGLRVHRANDAAEIGYWLGVSYWNNGYITEAVVAVIDFAFEVLGVHRLEARATLRNGRGNGALRKLGAVQEGVLRRSFVRNGEHLDQALWTILQEDWLEAKTVWGTRVIH